MGDGFFSGLYQKITRQEKAAFLAALFSGLATHLHIFSINLIFHDSTNIEGLCSTYASGRWLLGIFQDVAAYFLGIYQLPYFNGILCLLMLAVLAMLLVNAFHVQNMICAVYIGIMLVVFPSVASLFAFMFTAPAYMLSLLFAVGGVLLLHRRKTVAYFVVSAFLVCLSLGIYQAYLPFAASLALLLLLQEGLQTEITPLRLIHKGLLTLAMLLVGFLMYYGLNLLILQVKDVDILSYQGLDQMGRLELSVLPRMILDAYRNQLSGIWMSLISNRFEQRLIHGANLLTLLFFIHCLRQRKMSFKKKFVLSGMFALLPLAYNGIYVMVPVGSTGIHALMMYALVFTFLYPALLYWEFPSPKRLCRRILSCAAALLLWLTPMTFVYSSNIAYLNAELFQEQLTGYYASMITRIRSTEGYRDELPVTFVGFRMQDESLKNLPMTGRIYNYILSFAVRDAISTNSLFLDYCALHLGWGPTVLYELPEQVDRAVIEEMPCFPDQGSIRVVDDVIVVKIQELPEENDEN